MNYINLFGILVCCFFICCQQIMAQFDSLGYYPYAYGGIGSIYGRPGIFQSYGYGSQYSLYGSYPCYTSIYCGGGNNLLYSSFPYFYNNINTAFASSSSSAFSTYYGLNGGFFG